MSTINICDKKARAKRLSHFLPALFIELFLWFFIHRTGLAEEDRNILFIHILAAVSFLTALFYPRLKTVPFLRILLSAAAPALVFFLEEYILQNPFTNLSLRPLFINLLFFYLFAFFLYSVFNRADVSILLLSVLSLIVGIVNYFCLQFRSTPFLPWDIASIKIAANVAGNYSYVLIPSIGFSICFAVVLIQYIFTYNLRFFSRLSVRLVSILVSFAALLSSVLFLQTDKAKSAFDLHFDPTHMYDSLCHNGYMATFLMNLNHFLVAPEGYSDAALSALCSDYTSDSVSSVSREALPNVIVIMNESFADMSVLCDYTCNQDCLPFIHSLSENSARGNLHVSIIGGSTPNSEFEFLTSLSLAYLPVGSIPFQEYINSPMQSLASQFRQLGYTTAAFHPHFGAAWNRDVVYPRLGFDHIYFDDAFDSFETYNYWISDESTYACMKEILEESDKPLFLYTVTIQNHGSYFDNHTEDFDVRVEGVEDESVYSYMSLIKESDRAFGNLINDLKESDEKTVVLMFGDHQPDDSIALPLLANAGVQTDASGTAGIYTRYITPYILWANYDIDYEAPADISANYLSSVLMDFCSLPMTASQKYLLELKDSFPVISAKFICSASGAVEPIANYKNYEALRDYASLQYNFLADRDHLVEDFWQLRSN